MTHLGALLYHGLQILASDPKLIGRLLTFLGEMPVLPTRTLGGKVFWEPLAECEGWVVQQNRVFGNCRVLDPQGIRRAWGSKEAMTRAFSRLVGNGA